MGRRWVEVAAACASCAAVACGGWSGPGPVVDTEGPSTISGGDGTDSADSDGWDGGDGDGGGIDEAEVLWVENVPDAMAFDMTEDDIGSVYVLAAHGIQMVGDGVEWEEMRLHRYAVDGTPVWSGVVDDASFIASGPGTLALARPLFDAGGTSDAWVLDASGGQAWVANLSGTVHDLAVMQSGALIVVGSTQSGLGGMGDNVVGWVERVEPDGSTLWTETFGDPAMRASVISAVHVTPDDTITLGGRLGTSATSSQSQAWVAVSLDADGEERWSVALTTGVVTDRVADVAPQFGGWTQALVVSDPTEVVLIDDSGNEIRRDAFFWADRSGEQIAASGGSAYVVGSGRNTDPACQGPQCASTMLIARMDNDGSPAWAGEQADCGSPFGIGYWPGDALYDPHAMVGANCGDGFRLMAYQEDVFGWN